MCIRDSIYQSHNLFNPYLGYGTFVMPAIIMVIIQQTMLIGIGMIGGTWREFGLYRKLCPPDRKRMSTLPIVLGKALVYGMIYSVTTFYILGLHYRLFHYPMNGATGTIVVFMLAYMAACIALGIAISTLFRYRENSLLLLLWTSIPLLMLSGVSYPREGIPDWLFNLGQIFPSSHGVNAFIRIQSMGASLSEVLSEIRMLCILALVYGGLACIGSGTLLGVLILVLPSFKNWINATMGGPAVPATIISLVFGIVVSLMFPADTTPDDVRLKHVMDDRRGTVVEKVAAAEAAAEEEEDL